MNHRVQLCARGCLTLKLSLSSNTVTGWDEEAAASVVAEASLPPSGETGMVDKSTCSAILKGVWDLSRVDVGMGVGGVDGGGV